MYGVACTQADHNLPVTNLRNRNGDLTNPAIQLTHGEAAGYLRIRHGFDKRKEHEYSDDKRNP
ncbi:hypothetical protein D3C76_1709480 [compost metagenome]